MVNKLFFLELYLLLRLENSWIYIKKFLYIGINLNSCSEFLFIFLIIIVFFLILFLYFIDVW